MRLYIQSSQAGPHTYYSPSARLLVPQAGPLNVIRELFICFASVYFLTIEGFDILEDTVIAEVMASMAAFADFKGTIPCIADG